MYFSTLLSLTLAGASSFAAAKPIVSKSTSTSTWWTCITAHGNKAKFPLPTGHTKKTTKFKPIKIITMSIPTVTVTAEDVTEIESSTDFTTTTITEETATDTFSTTITEYATETTTTTDTTTFEAVETTSTTIVETNTVAARDGFRPIADTAATPRPVKRDEVVERKAPRKLGPKFGCVDNGKHATAVQCTTTYGIYPTQMITRKGKLTTTTLPGNTVTSTSWTTITVSETEVPRAETTEKFSTTIVNTVTESAAASTTTTTTTVLEATSTTSFFAACATDNILYSSPQSPGSRIVNAYHTPNLIGTAQAPSPYDCCVACINDATCGGSAWSSTGNNVCYLLRYDVCPTDQSARQGYFTWQPQGSGAGSFDLVMSNGYCGVYNDGGQGY